MCVHPDAALPRVLHYGDVLVKTIAAPLTEEELRWLHCDPGMRPPSPPEGGVTTPTCLGCDVVGIVVACAKNEAADRTDDTRRERPVRAPTACCVPLRLGVGFGFGFECSFCRSPWCCSMCMMGMHECTAWQRVSRYGCGWR
eukprot:COSAG01_NODE_8344_length_2822_cov_3.161219_2_plen_142_part_00